jgi:hypothetical protein
MSLTRRVKRSPLTQSFRIANAVTLAVGEYIAIASASGDAVQIADTAGHVPVGLAIGFDPPNESAGSTTGDTSATPPPEVIVDIQETILNAQTVSGVTAQTNVGDEVYAVAFNTFQTSATSNIPAVGKIVRWHSGESVDLLLYSMATIAAK